METITPPSHRQALPLGWAGQLADSPINSALHFFGEEVAQLAEKV
ncbi:MAG: hypothetical protein AAB528_05030 [Chloroflexota bacterium]